MQTMPETANEKPTPKLNNRTCSWHGYQIVGNEDYAFAINESDPEDIHHFDRDPEVNNDAFIRACGWAYEPND